jgi:hypothetical protein
MAQQRLQEAAHSWEQSKAEYARATEKKFEESKEKLAQLKRDFEVAAADLRQAIRDWHAAHRVALARFAPAV